MALPQRGAWRLARLWHTAQQACSGSQPSQLQPHQEQSLHRLLARLCPNTYGQGFSSSAVLHNTFQPSRLYPKQQRWTPEDITFWGLAGINVGMVVLTKSEAPEAREFVLQHLRTSVEAVTSGRVWTLATSMFSHYSAVHCAINLAMLALFRRTQQLSAAELVWLYLAGGIGGSVSHVAYNWFDAGGLEYGSQYALNTPAFFGCSGAVAAVTAYKAIFEPTAMRLLVVLPMPLAFAGFVYMIMGIKEAEYSDGPPAKLGGAAVGILAAVVALMTRRRRPAWLRQPPPKQ